MNVERLRNNFQTQGTTLIEVLAASIIVIIVIGAAVGAFFATVFNNVREIVDTETKPLTRSIEDALRMGARLHLAPDKSWFFADVEGVRVRVFLPKANQPFVELPDYNEDINGNGIADFASGPDVDWDKDGKLDAPNFAKPEYIKDNVDRDGDGKSWMAGDQPGQAFGSPEPFAPAVNGRSPAYDSDDSDGDQIIDDRALYLFPLGLLTKNNLGVFQENASSPPSWRFSSGLSTEFLVVPPLDEDLDRNGFVDFEENVRDESSLNLNFDPTKDTRFLPDSYEDLNGNGILDAAPPTTGTPLRDINNDGETQFYELAEDFNLNGFLDVPSSVPVMGSVYFHAAYGATNQFPADTLSRGLDQVGAPFPNTVFPSQVMNAVYAQQNQAIRNFGYSLRVEALGQEHGTQIGFGSVRGTRYRVTIFLYLDYVRTVEQFRSGELPKPVQVHRFEFEIP